METKQKIDFNSPEYLTWLHDMTIAGYERNIMLLSEHEEAIQAIYVLNDKKDIEKCLDHYEGFVRRWKALHEPGGDLYEGK